jgi:hypothetical protein
MEMFQKRTQRAAMILLVAALLLTAPLQAAGWTSREPGLLETAWSWLAEWFTGISAAQPALRSITAADEVPIPPTGKPGGEIPIGPSGDDGGGIDPNG